ncbi:hypothetical protein SAMN02746066_04423 [Anaerosporobacter mobilis DSM 15930]|jgi:hypothetical protein|uniref:Uncharacterized protein n=1 Tax=Anaerosporobacter mobilis DSM 15930 TaxID=1120996 RepID=A0A1M7NEX1_9FIRM|nr:hypothetical protein [Anaerosporobacter mobilis]SHN02244.1 hypothetical protein SAMN02746066_04423 [Anaerosporobacter mobilis DSM 15930]
MDSQNSSVSNKNNSGKGNGNSIIKHEAPKNSTTNYVSGEVPTSTAHKFQSSTQNEAEDMK